MPRPIAAGVFGMARTSAAPGNASSRKRSVRPAMIETTTVAAPTNGASAGITSGAICGFTATTTAATSPSAPGDGLRRRPRRAQRRDLARGLRLDHGDLLGAKPERQPALQHGAAHLARADQQDGSGQIAERFRR